MNIKVVVQILDAGINHTTNDCYNKLEKISEFGFVRLVRLGEVR